MVPEGFSLIIIYMLVHSVISSPIFLTVLSWWPKLHPHGYQPWLCFCNSLQAKNTLVHENKSVSGHPTLSPPLCLQSSMRTPKVVCYVHYSEWWIGWWSHYWDRHPYILQWWPVSIYLCLEMHSGAPLTEATYQCDSQGFQSRTMAGENKGHQSRDEGRWGMISHV